MHRFRSSESKRACAFCRRGINEVDKLIVGPFVDVCNSCITKLHNALQNNEKQQKAHVGITGHIPIPQAIKKFLDDFVIGQDEAKIALSVAVYNHYKRIIYKEYFQKKNVEIEKSNVIIIGSSGTGKTLLARTLARKLKVPFAIVDATTLTEAGYVGDDVESILLKLYQASDNNIEKAEQGIIYIDEIDKIARKGENVSITRDVSGEGVQQALLKIIEGTEATFSPTGGRKHPNQQLMRINTTNILFICGGAFIGLEELVRQRTLKSHLGFTAPDAHTQHEHILKQTQTEDLIKFGIIPEFIGRMPVLITLDEMTRDDIIAIARVPKNAIVKQYQALLKADSIELVIEDDAVEAIADYALLQKSGARGLRAVIEKIITKTLFNVTRGDNTPTKVVITKECIVQGKEPHVTRSKRSA